METTPHRGRAGRAKQRSTLPQPQLFLTPIQTSDSDERYTPAWIFDDLGCEFDIDVAAPPGGVPWVPAKSYFTAADDGLALPWSGLVWCNPPYSHVTPWADRMMEHRSGWLLAPLAHTRWCRNAVASADVVAIPSEPLYFESPCHTGRHISFFVVLYGWAVSAAGLRDSGRWRVAE